MLIFFLLQLKKYMKDTGIFLEDKEFYNVEEVAQLFSVSERTVRRWIEHDMVQTYKPTRKHLITTKSIRKFIIEGTESK